MMMHILTGGEFPTEVNGSNRFHGFANAPYAAESMPHGYKKIKGV